MLPGKPHGATFGGPGTFLRAYSEVTLRGFTIDQPACAIRLFALDGVGPKALLIYLSARSRCRITHGQTDRRNR